MDAITVGLIIGLATLFIERGFSWAGKIKQSKCSSCCNVEMK